MWFLLFTTWTSNFESSNSYSSTMFLHGENPKKNNIPRIFPSPPAAPCNASARHWNPALPGFPMILLVCQNSPSCTPKTGPKRTSSQPKKKPKDLNQGNAADVSWNGSTGKKNGKALNKENHWIWHSYIIKACLAEVAALSLVRQPGSPGFAANPSKDLSCHAKFTAVREVQALNLKS